MPRSGLSIRESIDVVGSIIDADYRGKTKVLLVNQSNTFYQAEIGEKIAQLILKKLRCQRFLKLMNYLILEEMIVVVGLRANKFVFVNMFFRPIN